MTRGNSEEIEIRFVSADIIREAFNSGQFWQRAMNGEFRVELDKNEHFNRRQARLRGHRYCTRSQIVRYRDGNRTIAVMHQIRNPDGTLGASGMPDPKHLDLGYTILKTRS